MKMIKKITSVALGATMIGATIGGALALDLATYPKPFVNGCSFDGAIVVGANAASSDVAGAIDIASSLAISGTSSTAVTTANGVSVSGEAVQMRGTSDNLWIGKTLLDVKPVDLDDKNLPTILAKGTYMAKDGDEFDYKQKLNVSNDLKFQHFSNSDYKDKTPVLGIPISDGAGIATYDLEFTKAAESAVNDNNHLTDFEDSQIRMLGKDYDIVTAVNGTDIKLELMGGAVKDMLGQGESRTYTINGKTYAVEVTYIGTTSGVTQVKFKVNGQITPAKIQGSTFKLSDGTQIGVRELLETKSGDISPNQVEFYIGAEKLTLENARTVMQNDKNIDGLTANIDATYGSTTKINDIKIDWSADGPQFITEDSFVEMPGLESFKITYQGYSIPITEKTNVIASGDDVMTLKTFIEDSDSHPETIELLSTVGTSTYNQIGGDGANKHLGTSPDSVPLTYSLADGSKTQYFVATYQGGKTGESYLLKVDRATTVDGVDIKNVATGEVIETQLKAGSIFTVGSTAIKLDSYAQGVNAIFSQASTATHFDRIISKQGLLVMLPVAGINSTPFINLGTQNSYVLQIMEADKDGNIGYGNDINVTLGLTSDNNVKVSGLTPESKSLLSNGALYEIQDTNVYTGYEASALGTRLNLDQGPDQYSLELNYHGGESYGNVFVSAKDTGFGSVSSVSGGATVCPVTLPAAMLDSEVSNYASQNLIVVGGPCVNTVSALLMGNQANCAAGFSDGKATIKLFNTGAGKVAMLVAGMSAADTRRATRVLKNYKDYAMTGDEVVVTGTSLTDINVAPYVAPVTPVATE